jgi:hypothetical protein
MITRSIQDGPPRRTSLDEREPVDSPRPPCGLFCRHASLRTWAAARRSVLDRSGHHAVLLAAEAISRPSAIWLSRLKMMWLRLCAAVSAASFMTLIGGNQWMDQSSKRLSRCYLTVQISERLRHHGLVDRVLRRAGFEPYAQSLRICSHPRTHGLASPPAQLKTRAHSSRPSLSQCYWSATLGSAARSSVATSRINPPAGDTSHIHSGRAARARESAGAAEADRVASATACRSEGCSRSTIVCSSPRSSFRGTRSPIATSTSTAKASIHKSHSCRSRRCPAWASNPANRARLLTQPTPLLLARIPTHRLNCALARSAVTLTVTGLFHVPPPISDESTSIHLLHHRYQTPTWLTARLIRFAFSGCDDEHSQAQCRVGV